MFIRYIVMFALLSLSQGALSQVYKCKTAKGKIIYSEEPCTSGLQGGQLNLEDNVLDNSGFRKQAAIRETQQNHGSSQSTTTDNHQSLANKMSAYDKELRLRELKMDMIDQQSSAESRTDASREYRYLDKNTVNALSYEDEIKRRNLKVDLGSYNRSKRDKAISQLTQIYTKYEA